MFRREKSISMAVSTKNIVAYPETCAKMNCNSCDLEDCLLCSPCMDEYTKVQLTNAYREYIDRHDCKRVFPPKFVSYHDTNNNIPIMNRINELCIVDLLHRRRLYIIHFEFTPNGVQ